jgi:hypothetical protein
VGMSGYTKLFNTILASTIWREPNHVRIVWITLLAMADKHGLAEGSVPGLADFARVSIDECRDALRRLEDPDRDSRSQEHDGRRILPVDGGWLLLNHAKYRQKLNEDERREYLRIKKAESRRRSSTDSQQVSRNVNSVKNCPDSSTPSTQAEAEAEAHTEAEAVTTKSASAPLMTSPAAYDRLKKTHAFVGSRLHVPTVLHSLQAWYLELNDAAEVSGEAIPDVFVWLRPKFVAWAAPAAHQQQGNSSVQQQRQRTAEMKRLMAEEGLTVDEAARRVGY